MLSEKSTIGDNIRKYRKLAGIFQDVLSKKADALGISLDDLMK